MPRTVSNGSGSPPGQSFWRSLRTYTSIKLEIVSRSLS